MTARQLRRAQEHKERKLARKAEIETAPQTAVDTPAAEPTAIDDSHLALFREAGLNPHLASDRARMLAAITAEISSLEDYTATLDLDDEPAPAQPAPVTPPFDAPKASRARLTANRANAELSTGPRSAQGKAVSSLNSLKTGLTGRTVLLPSEDIAAYQDHCLRLRNRWLPEGDDETTIVQSIADTEWRLLRIPALEYAIYAKGRGEFSEKVTAADPASQAALLDLETFLRYEKQLRNLTLQEGRLNRQRDKHIAELRQLQAERRTRQEEQSAAIVKAATVPDHSLQNRPVPLPARNGFVFSTASPETPFNVSSAPQAASNPPLS